MRLPPCFSFPCLIFFFFWLHTHTHTHKLLPWFCQNDSGNVRYPEFCRYMAKVVSPMQMDLE